MINTWAIMQKAQADRLIYINSDDERPIVPTLRVGMQLVTLCVTPSKQDAERPGRHSHAERGNDHHR
ncbi:hypothetical protein [Pseudomonas sp. 58 R 3]|nr:hypothetical protein [Pseudomonas sp. 58 R 3]